MKEYIDRSPLIFDKQTDGELVTLWERSGGTVETSGYESAVLEFDELRSKLGGIKLDEDSVASALFSVLKSENEGKSTIEEIRNLRVVSDLVEFSKRVKKIENLGSIENRANWIMYEKERRLIKYVPRDVHRILQDSRSIGLRPLAVTDALRNLRIKCLGLSAASPTVDLLVAAGAENITGFDGGIIDPSNLPRFVGPMASEKNLGNYKAEVLAENLYGRNPYGFYELSPGRVVISSSEISTPYDTTMEKFVEGADLILEVVDDVYIKSGLDNWMSENGVDVPVMFMADLSLPIAGINLPSMGDHFNQKIPGERLLRMADRKSGIHPLSLVSEMIGDDLPDDHILQFLLMKQGLMPYWSQLPESSRELASLSVYLIEAYLDGRGVLGKNFNIKTVPRGLMGSFSTTQKLTIDRLRKDGFSF